MSALEQLSQSDEDRPSEAKKQAARGVPVVGYTSNTVPYELIRAAGCFPFLLTRASAATPFADRFMESVFHPRVRGIFDGLLAGEWPFLSLVVIPRTSEQEHKLFLYLKETARQGFAPNLPPVHLFDLLHTGSPEARAYGFDRMQVLVQHLDQLAGHAVSLAEAIAESNAARAAIRILLGLRAARKPRLPGTEALSLLRPYYFMDRGKYAILAAEAAEEISHWSRIDGPRILVMGPPLDHAGLHAAIEFCGAVVVAEDDWFGSRCGGEDIASPTLAAVFQKYYYDSPSPRVFPEASDWFEREALSVDGVLFYQPPEDDVLGWDYPRQRDYLDRHGIPHLRLRADALALSLKASNQIRAFVRSLEASK